MSANDSASRAPSSLSRPAQRAQLLEDLARAFVQDADRLAAETFAEIGAALIPFVEMSTAVSIARLLAGRTDAPPAVLAALAARGLKPKGAKARAAAPEPPAATARPETPRDILLHGDARGRRRLFADAARFAALDPTPRRRIDSVASLALARASERRDQEDATVILARLLQTTPAALAPMLTAPDLIAVALRAAGLSDDDAIRVCVGFGLSGRGADSPLQIAIGTFQELEQAQAIRLLAIGTDAVWSPRTDAAATASEGAPRRGAASAATFSPSLDGHSAGTKSSGDGVAAARAAIDAPRRAS